MAIGVDQIYLSMSSTDTGEYLTANVYTVDGVYEADGVTPRRLSIGQLVMALCLQRAAQLERGFDYTNPTTGEVTHVDGIVEIMANLENVSTQLECMTKIENEILEGDVNLDAKTLVYNGREMSYSYFLDSVMNLEDVPSAANADSKDLITAIEAKMDENNTFSQKTMIELQSQTNKRDQAYDMISNVLKSINTVTIANVNNM